MTMIGMRKNIACRDHVYEPTPKEIQRSCKEIQATWSPLRRVQRERGLRGTWWTPPMIRLSDLIEAVSQARADNPL